MLLFLIKTKIKSWDLGKGGGRTNPYLPPKLLVQNKGGRNLETVELLMIQHTKLEQKYQQLKTASYRRLILFVWQVVRTYCIVVSHQIRINTHQ